jgi:hypothetical protein
MTFLKRNRVCVCECVLWRWTSEQHNAETCIRAANTVFIEVFRFTWQVMPKYHGSYFLRTLKTVI